MRMRATVEAVDAAVCAALADTPWEREPTVRAQTEDDADEWPSREHRLVWCGSYDAIRRRYPDLPQSHGNQTGGCVDLWVHIDEEAALSEVNFEGRSLSDTFRLMHRPAEAEEADALLGRPADVVAPYLARHLVDILSDAPAAGR
jgi:hypothetical protein